MITTLHNCYNNNYNPDLAYEMELVCKVQIRNSIRVE